MDSLKLLVTRTRVEGLVILLVALAYLWEAHNVPEFYQIPGVPGPTTFPYILGLIFAACGVWLLVSPKDLLERLAKAKQVTPAASAATSAPRPGLFARITSEWHLAAMWVVIIIYLWFMPDLGFPLATLALLVTFFYLLGETRWLIVLGLALVSTVVIYVLFKMGLNVRLPLGVLDFLTSK
jgi:putative tricarboxylic transport membrane protein